MSESAWDTAPKILVVEDEQIVALDVEAQLVRLGYEVVGVASTGKEALVLTQQTCPDLVLMDVQLQGSLDGIATAEQIRRRWQIPVVFATAFAGEETLARARATGPYGFLTKPFKSNDLRATVSVALEQHRTTREIFQEHSWLRTLLAGMSDGVVATDVDGRVKYLNPIAEKLIGRALIDALGRPIEEVYPLRTEQGEPLEQCQLRRVLAENQAIGRQRFQLVAHPDQIVIVEDSAAPIHNAEGKLAGAVTVIVDITERQKAEREREQLLRELERSNADLVRFSYTVSHDLQAPVRTVSSFAQLLSRHWQGQLDQTSAEYLALITDAAKGMQRLIQSLLQYAQTGQAPLQREEVAVSDALADVERRLAASLTETQAEIRAGQLPTIWADRVQVQQLFQNLLGNALQYRLPDQAPLIAITAETTSEGWAFAVADQGPGIPPLHLEHIFTPLTRLHGPNVPGTGLGLALCRVIVERHGGRIWAESAGSGQGATIRFVLPRASVTLAP